MKTRLRFTISVLMSLAIVFAAYAVSVHAQTGVTDHQRASKKRLAPQAGPNLPVQGGGTAGQLTKWIGANPNGGFVLGDSILTETDQGNIGIGMSTPTSRLSVQGMIETAMGGYKFPDGTIQTTAGVTSVIHDPSLAGNGTSGSPLGIASGQVITSLNGLTDNVNLAAGSNITLTPEGNTLTIASTGADPAKNAFQTKILLRILPNEANVTGSIDIPSGKRFGIEYITINGSSNDLDDLFFPVRIVTMLSGTQVSYQIQPIFFNRFASGADKQVRIYADAPKLFFAWQRVGNGEAFMSVSLSGYLVDLP